MPVMAGSYGRAPAASDRLLRRISHQRAALGHPPRQCGLTDAGLLIWDRSSALCLRDYSVRVTSPGASPSNGAPGRWASGNNLARLRASAAGGRADGLAISDRSYATMNKTSAITRRRVLELFGATSLPLALLRYGRAADKIEKERRILFFTKSSGFEHDPVKRSGAAPSLSELTLSTIGKKHGFEIVATKDGRVFDGNLAQYDAFLFYTTGNLTESGTDEMPPMSALGKQALLSAIGEGKGFIGVHSASDTFHSKGNRSRPRRTQTRLSQCSAESSSVTEPNKRHV
jgi:Trehalose utilisation